MKKLLRAKVRRSRLEFFRVPVRGERSIKWLWGQVGGAAGALQQGRDHFAPGRRSYKGGGLFAIIVGAATAANGAYAAGLAARPQSFSRRGRRSYAIGGVSAVA